MSPEELFKIEDTSIPEVKEESVVSSEENTIEKKKIDVFDKNLTIEDLMEFLKNNNIPNDQKTIEKYYEEIITNNIEKESITEVIKELDVQREKIIQEIETDPNNQTLLKKINDLEDKISDLNTAERVREDNVKTVIREISTTNRVETALPKDELQLETKESQPAIGSEIQPEEMGVNQESKIEPEEMGVNQESKIEPEEMGVNQESNIKVEESQAVKLEQMPPIPENKNQTSNIELEKEETKALNLMENVEKISSEEDKEFLKMMDKDETLEEIRKNNEMLGEMSKNINYNLELVLKAISETAQTQRTEKEPEMGEAEPNYRESPKISQPQYIDEYRKSLRKYGGLESFMGYDIPFKGDNLGSYV